jgi:hypothetical protein
VGLAECGPHQLPGDRRIRAVRHVQALPRSTLAPLYQQHLKTQNYFVGLL